MHNKSFQIDNDRNHTHITSFKAILAQKVQFEDDDKKHLNNLSIEALNNKIKDYNKLFIEKVRSY